MATGYKIDFVMDLPYHQKREIFLSLSGADLENCRVVSSAWRSYLATCIWNHKPTRALLSKRLEHNWKNKRFTATDTVCEVEFPFHIDALSSKFVCLRTHKDTPLQSAVVRILDIKDPDFYWDVPNLFWDINRFACTNFAVALSDTLLAVRTMLKTHGAPVWNLQVFNLKTRAKVADENLMNLFHFIASQTSEDPDTLILFRGFDIRK